MGPIVVVVVLPLLESCLEQAGVVDDLAKKYLEPLYGVDPNSIPMWTVQK